MTMHTLPGNTPGRLTSNGRDTSMRIAVTGARGRVGRSLVQALVVEGHHVVAIDVIPPTADATSAVTAVQVGLDDTASLTEVMTGTDVVVHLAAYMSWREDEIASVFDANVVGTFHLLQAAASASVRRVVFASSGEVYPESHPTYQPLDEDHPTKPASAYGMTKLLGEEMVGFFGRKYGLETVILRFSHTQDAAELLDEDSFFSGPRFFLNRRLEQQAAFGNGPAVRALQTHDDGGTKLLLARGEDGTPFRMGICDTRDLVAGIVLAVTHAAAVGETFGIGPDAATSMDQLVPAMAELTGLKVADVRLPGPAVNYETSNQKARDVLGFRPQWPTDAMLQEAYAVWRTNSKVCNSATSTPDETRR